MKNERNQKKKVIKFLLFTKIKNYALFQAVAICGYVEGAKAGREEKTNNLHNNTLISKKQIIHLKL